MFTDVAVIINTISSLSVVTNMQGHDTIWCAISNCLLIYPYFSE